MVRGHSIGFNQDLMIHQRVSEFDTAVDQVVETGGTGCRGLRWREREGEEKEKLSTNTAKKYHGNVVDKHSYLHPERIAVSPGLPLGPFLVGEVQAVLVVGRDMTAHFRLFP